MESKLNIQTEDNEHERSKPLSSLDIYDRVKGAVLSLPFSSSLFEKAVEALNVTTRFLNERTSASVVVIDQESAEEFTSKLDGYVSDQLLRLDDGLDNLRRQLYEALQALYMAIRTQMQLLRAGKLPEAAARGFGASYGIAMGVFQAVGNRVKTNYPETYDKLAIIAGNLWSGLENRVEVLVNSAKVSVDNFAGHSRNAVNDVDVRITEASAYILQSAQPYMHTAVQRSAPLFNSAVEASQPYVAQAKPYFEPLVNRAQEVHKALEDNKLVGPYVARAYENVNRTLQDAKVYCLAEDIADAQGPIRSAASGLGAAGALPLCVVPAVAERAVLTLDRVAKGRMVEEVAVPVAAVAEGAVLVRDVVAGATAGAAQGRGLQKMIAPVAQARDVVVGAAAGASQGRAVQKAAAPVTAARDAVAGAAAGAAQCVGLAK